MTPEPCARDYADKELVHVGFLLQQNLDISDRRFRMRSYKQVFVGEQAVIWLVSSGKAATTADAVRLGNRLLDAGILHHVTRSQPFKNEFLFYRFTPGEEGVLGSSAVRTLSVAPPSYPDPLSPQPLSGGGGGLGGGSADGSAGKGGTTRVNGFAKDWDGSKERAAVGGQLHAVRERLAGLTDELCMHGDMSRVLVGETSCLRENVVHMSARLGMLEAAVRRQAAVSRRLWNALLLALGCLLSAAGQWLCSTLHRHQDDLARVAHAAFSAAAAAAASTCSAGAAVAAAAAGNDHDRGTSQCTVEGVPALDLSSTFATAALAPPPQAPLAALLRQRSLACPELWRAAAQDALPFGASLALTLLVAALWLAWRRRYGAGRDDECSLHASDAALARAAAAASTSGGKGGGGASALSRQRSYLGDSASGAGSTGGGFAGRFSLTGQRSLFSLAALAESCEEDEGGGGGSDDGEDPEEDHGAYDSSYHGGTLSGLAGRDGSASAAAADAADAAAAATASGDHATGERSSLGRSVQLGAWSRPSPFTSSSLSVPCTPASAAAAAAAGGGATPAAAASALTPPSSRRSTADTAVTPSGGGGGGGGESGGRVKGRKWRSARLSSSPSSSAQPPHSPLPKRTIAPALAAFQGWPDSPVMVMQHPGSSEVVGSPGGPAGLPQTLGGTAAAGAAGPGGQPHHPVGALRVNNCDPIAVESDVFVGGVHIYIRNLDSSPAHVFKGRSRLAMVAVQGKFKKALRVDDVVTVHDGELLAMAPTSWFLHKMIIATAKRHHPCLRMVGTGEDVSWQIPFISHAQIINVSKDGEQPHHLAAKEDMRLFDPHLTLKDGGPWSATRRREHYSRPQARRSCVCHYDTEHVYTFLFWQDLMDFSEYGIHICGLSYDLFRHLNGNPVQMAARDTASGCNLFSFQVWHQLHAKAEARAAARSSTSSSGDHAQAAADAEGDADGGQLSPGARHTTPSVSSLLAAADPSLHLSSALSNPLSARGGSAGSSAAELQASPSLNLARMQSGRSSGTPTAGGDAGGGGGGGGMTKHPSMVLAGALSVLSAFGLHKHSSSSGSVGAGGSRAELGGGSVSRGSRRLAGGTAVPPAVSEGSLSASSSTPLPGMLVAERRSLPPMGGDAPASAGAVLKAVKRVSLEEASPLGSRPASAGQVGTVVATAVPGGLSLLGAASSPLAGQARDGPTSPVGCRLAGALEALVSGRGSEGDKAGEKSRPAFRRRCSLTDLLTGVRGADVVS